MKSKTSAAIVAGALLLPLAVMAQNVAVVNGKPVPKSRLEALLKNAARSGQPVSPEMEAQARDTVVLRAIFAQEAERQGVAKTAEYQQQMEMVRETVLVRTLFDNFQKNIKISDADAKAEYDKVKKENAGTEYSARHILVDSEDEAKKLLADLKAGAKFEDLAKKSSKDTGSAENGGDLGFAKPDTYVPEFAAALAKLQKGQTTDAPVKTQFGYHIIKLEDTRSAQFPAFEEIKAQVVQHLTQQKLQDYQQKLRDSAKTDYKFSDATKK